jgi:hypothetical protein
MKKFCVAIILASAIATTSSLSFAQELGEFCWQSKIDPCVLRLHTIRHQTYFSFHGKQACVEEDGIVIRHSPNPHFIGREYRVRNLEAHAHGSGYIHQSQVKIGLTFIEKRDYMQEEQFGGTVRENEVSRSHHAGDINLNDLSISLFHSGGGVTEYAHVPCEI